MNYFLFQFYYVFYIVVLKYKVEVHTGSIPNAATNANVYLMLVGERGDTGHRKLLQTRSEESVKFQAGQVSSSSNYVH